MSLLVRPATPDDAEPVGAMRRTAYGANVRAAHLYERRGARYITDRHHMVVTL